MNFHEISKKCGGVAKIADYFGITQWAVRKWGVSRIPAERCQGLIELSQNSLSLHDLRPDLFKSYNNSGSPKD